MTVRPAGGEDYPERRGPSQGASPETPVGEGVRTHLPACGVHDLQHLALGAGVDRLAVEVVRQAGAGGQGTAELLTGPGEASGRISSGKRGVAGRDAAPALGRGDEDRADLVAVQQVILDVVIGARRELAEGPGAGARLAAARQVKRARLSRELLV